MHNLSLENRILDNSLTVLRSHSRQPNHLLLAPPVHEHISRELMSTDMRNKIDPHTTGSFIIEVAIQSAWSQMSLHLFFD